MLTFTVAYIVHSLQRQEIIPRCIPPLQTWLSSYWEAISLYSSDVTCTKGVEIFALKSPMFMGNWSYKIHFTRPSYQANEWHRIQPIWKLSNGITAAIPDVLSLFLRNTPSSTKYRSASPFPENNHVQALQFHLCNNKLF